MVTVQGSDGSDGVSSLLIPNRLFEEWTSARSIRKRTNRLLEEWANARSIRKRTLILWLDHAANKVYRLSAIMTYILSLLLLLYYNIDVLNELCMMLPAGVHNVCLQTSTGL